MWNTGLTISRAMRKFSRHDAQYEVLGKLLAKAHTCSFCGKSCNRDIRACAEATCGPQARKALKDLIRKADNEREKEFDPIRRAKMSTLR